jgi:hypothetical protein
MNTSVTRLDHPLFDPSCMHHAPPSHLSAQNDASHPGSERELVITRGLGVDTRELGDELVGRSRRPIPADLPVVAVGSSNQNWFIPCNNLSGNAAGQFSPSSG